MPLLPALKAVLFAPHSSCPLCGRAAETGDRLCAVCRRQLNAEFLQEPAVRLRGLPSVSAAAWPYREPARRLVHLFKYGGDPDLARLLGEGMTAALSTRPDLLAAADAVMAVPLYAARERERGFNQAALLAQEVCAHTGLTCMPDVLLRTAPTPPLEPFRHEQRVQALRGVFRVSGPQAVRGRNIILVDDVYTTGATASACAAVLRACGARDVMILTACRVYGA